MTPAQYRNEICDLAFEGATRADIEAHDWPNDLALDVLRHADASLATVPAAMDGATALWYLAVEAMWADVQREKTLRVA